MLWMTVLFFAGITELQLEILNKFWTIWHGFKSTCYFRNLAFSFLMVSNADRKLIPQTLQVLISNKIGTYLECTNVDNNKLSNNIIRKLGQKLAC